MQERGVNQVQLAQLIIAASNPLLQSGHAFIRRSEGTA
jgi:hypothetical protein